MRRQAFHLQLLLVVVLLPSLFLHRAAAFVPFPSPRPTPRINPSAGPRRFSWSAKLSKTSDTIMSTMSSTTCPEAAQHQPHVMVTLHPNGVLELQLNRPKALNALSLSMLHEMKIYVEGALVGKSCGGEGAVKALILTASEDSRAFSAGGDIKEVLAGRLSQDEAIKKGCDPLTYITVEYQVDSLLHKLAAKVPVVAVCDGIVMGGGAGIFQSATFRVVTPTSTFAMPECRIAILPDAGAMSFLFRAPGEVPLYCALTGARLQGRCMQAVGLATHVVESKGIPNLLSLLRTEDPENFTEILTTRQVAEMELGETPIEARRPVIDAVFAHNTVREIYNALVEIRQQEVQEAHAAESASVCRGKDLGGGNTKTEGTEGKESNSGEGRGRNERGESWIETALAALTSECPASHVVTLHAVRTAQCRGLDKWDIDQGLGIEHVANRCLGFRQDFVEGVSTAVGTKKGSKPVWSHSDWEAVERDPEIIKLLQAMTKSKYFWDEINQRTGK